MTIKEEAMLQMYRDFWLQVDRETDWLCVTICGDPRGGHDWSTLARRVQQALDRHFNYRLILDLNQSTYAHRRQIGQMLAIQGWLHARQGTMRLCGLSLEVEWLFRCCGLDRAFSIYRDRQDAIHRLNAPATTPGQPR